MKKLIAAVSMLSLGCISSQTGIQASSNSSSSVQILDVTYDNYRIPVVSVVSGPTSKVWVNRDSVSNVVEITAYGSVTNNSSIMGIYDSQEHKETMITIGLRK